jgi:hypothetical protein
MTGNPGYRTANIERPIGAGTTYLCHAGSG